uniref:Uncharacterized protein n=2 Tax=Sphaerodactylus townsendi TaxID=933632 RepID=A0ACB8ELK2_9SAUR
MEKDSGVDQHQQRGHSLHCSQISSPIQISRNQQSENLQSRLPITQHFGKSRPRRPQRQTSTSELQAQSTAPALFPLEPDAFAAGGEDFDPGFLEPGGLDLLGEIFETLSFLEPSRSGQPLFGTRSLDFSSLDDMNFYTQLRPSEETLHETLSEEQDDGSSSLEALASLEEEENLQGALLPSRGGGSPETPDSPSSENIPVPLQEEAEEATAPSDCDLPRDAQTHNADTEASTPSGSELDTQEVGQPFRADQTLASLAAPTLPEAELPGPSGSDVQSPAAMFHVDSGFPAQETTLTVGRVTSPPHPSVARNLTQTRVSELKKRFEA